MRRPGLQWLSAAIISLATTAACSGSAADPEAAAGTPTSTIDVPGSDTTVPPPVVRSPSAARFDWTAFVDEPTGTSAALPVGAQPIANPILLPDGATVMSRGYVFEHADGVLGFEVIEEFATADDLRKIATFLADSVDGWVDAIDEVDADPAEGADGLIRYGDDQLMLFRILVLNANGDVWSGFVGGPEADRDRLESEFTRLTVSADLEQAIRWVRVTDPPSGIVVDLPGQPEAREVSPGVRDYYNASVSAGFVVIDQPGADFDPEAELASMAESVGGTVQGSEPYELLGYPGIEGDFRAVDTLYLVRIVPLDQHVLTLVSAVDHRYVGFAEDELERMSDSVVIP